MKKAFIIPIFIMLILVSSCTDTPSGAGSSDDDIPAFNQSIDIESSGMTMIASTGFSTAARGVSDASEYLVYRDDSGEYSPILFRTSAGDLVMLGASSGCYDGKVQILAAGDDSFLCVFDRMIAVDARSELIRNENGSFSISFKGIWSDDQKNIAYINTASGSAYLLNRPGSEGTADYLHFLLFDGNTDSYGYSDNKVYILADNGSFYSFSKANPSAIIPINHGSYHPLTRNADLFTDDYVIYQYYTEIMGDEPAYIEVFDSTGEKPYGKTDIESNQDVLDNSLFRVGNSIFARERVAENNSYSLRIYPILINDSLEMSHGEGKEFAVADNLTQSTSQIKIKNSNIYIYENGSTLLIRTENQKYAEPMLVSAAVDRNGELSGIHAIKLTDGTFFPYPMSDAAVFMDSSLYWVEDVGSSTIYKADISTGTLNTIEIPGKLASKDIAVLSDGSIIYHSDITGNTVGTYCWNERTDSNYLLSYNRMDVHQIYSI